MGRELRRKQAKKEGKSLKREISNNENQLKKLLLITVLLVVIIGIIYLISALFITKELDWFSKEESGTSQSQVTNTILATEIFNQKEEEYYVYFYDYSDEDTQVTSKITSTLSSKKIYKVDTNSALNSNFVAEESNRDAKTLQELKVISPTLIKIIADEIVEYYESNEILTNLK